MIALCDGHCVYAVVPCQHVCALAPEGSPLTLLTFFCAAVSFAADY